MREEVFVTEENSLRTKVIKGIHLIECEGSSLRIFTFDTHRTEVGTERRVNGHFLIQVKDVLQMIDEVTRFMGERGVVLEFPPQGSKH